MPFFFPRWAITGVTPEMRGALTTLLKLDPSARERVKQAVKEVGYPFRATRLREKAKQLHSELKLLDEDTLYAGMDAVTDLVRLPPSILGDFATEIVKDTDIASQNLESLVKDIASDPRIVEQRAIAEFKELAVPELGRMEHSCGVRARFDKKFDYFEDKIETYSARIVDVHPFVLVRLYFDSPDKAAVFQLDEERLDRLIAELLASQRQLKAVTQQFTKAHGEANGRQD